MIIILNHLGHTNNGIFTNVICNVLLMILFIIV